MINLKPWIEVYQLVVQMDGMKDYNFLHHSYCVQYTAVLAEVS